MKVAVVCEHNPSMDTEEGKKAYPEGMNECLADVFREAGCEVTLLRADENGVHGLDETLKLHDFRVVPGPTHTNIIFDILLPFDFKMSDDEVVNYLQKEIHRIDKSYYAVIQVDKAYY